MLRSAECPGWLGYWGYAGGVIAILGAFFPLYTPLYGVRAFGGVIIILWILIAGITLLRSR